jgi:hypothetical protein
MTVSTCMGYIYYDYPPHLSFLGGFLGFELKASVLLGRFLSFELCPSLFFFRYSGRALCFALG